MEDASSPWEGISSILTASGTQVPARARFAGQALISGSFGAITFGFVAGQIGAVLTPVGPLIPFLFGSTTGFGMGVYNCWLARKSECITYARHYPRILIHALWADQRIIVPRHVLQESLKDDSNDEDSNDNQQDDIAETDTAMTLYKRQSQPPPIHLEDWVQNQGLGHLSYCILAAMSCKPDVLEAEKQQRTALVESVGQEGIKSLAGKAIVKKTAFL
jgi:hypothetical protein